METRFLFENLTNPALMFFFLGLLAVWFKSDLRVPPNSSKFITLYLLFAIGFKGGQELSHSTITTDMLGQIAFGLGSSILIPVAGFFLLKNRFGVANAAAIGAAYGSVSAVTFVTAVSFLEGQGISFGGHMIALMSLMETPAILVSVALMSRFERSTEKSLWSVIRHTLTNGSILLILGSLIIGMLASETQAEGIRPFTTDLFKGFLVLFLLDMGIKSGNGMKSFFKNGLSAFSFATLVPLLNGCIMAYASSFLGSADGDRFLLSILAASASYIAVPATMRWIAPQANTSLYLPMALAITFPVNISIGMPLYLCIIQVC